ncbi:helix-turn-helix domain-containing protein [Arenimonas fontis]|uniref:AraC family transcriptional regulator n=1 Tax=Arenimonas fontis TaxID=2608255 RepID=A0A5B2Z750_9GAMM|nr:helix-turn-helix domain-containing protein [Arenimonas fontis]KAA2284016.1 AraC family transcriptional regulator [Arenimonas fontis]
MDGTPRHRHLHVHHQDDALGRWTVAWRSSPAALADVVTMLWYGEGRVAYQRDRILPSGGSQLLINLGPVQYRIEPGPPERRVPFRDVWYSGLHQGPIDTEAPHGNALFGVTFRAAGARPWLGVDADRLVGRVLPLEDLVGGDAQTLRERLLETRTLEARFALVEDWLLARLRPRYAPSPLTLWALGRIEASAGRLPVETLAREAGVSRKHLAVLFRRQVGMGMKSLARVHRFRAATALLAGRERVPWAELAEACGYFDQSHLVRDFRAFSGLSPGQFIRHAMADGGSLVLR